jgi:hypothetical protein
MALNLPYEREFSSLYDLVSRPRDSYKVNYDAVFGPPVKPIESTGRKVNGCGVFIDSAMPDTRIDFRRKDGQLVGRIENVGRP